MNRRKPYKILIAGDWHSQIHEEPLASALTRAGQVVFPFKWCRFFRHYNPSSSSVEKFLSKIQDRFSIGPIINRINNALVESAAHHKPDIILTYRGIHIWPYTLHAIRKKVPGVLLAAYNNDNFTSPFYPKYFWRHFIQSIREYDLGLAYREENLSDYKRYGIVYAAMMMPWFLPDLHKPIELTVEEKEKYACDVVFVGHYEKDERIDCLTALNWEGIHVKIFGPNYPKNFKLQNYTTDEPIQPVRGLEYTKALCGSKIALCFFSRLNADQYTRRNFEIPATRTMMISQYSEKLAELFRPSVEADYFRSKEELVKKVRHYLENNNIRNEIADNGYRRVYEGRHDIDSRVEDLVKIFQDIRG